MISVDEATARIVASLRVTASETTAIGEADGRVTAVAAFARLTHPPAPVSSMDGYAVRAEDAAMGSVLRVVGTAPAGHPFAGRVGKGEAVRIFTGGVVPDGANSIVIQEDASQTDDRVTINAAAVAQRHIRVAGLDFKTGDVLAPAGKRLSARDLSLLAAGDLAELSVRRKPRVAIAATGDELSLPGAPRPPGGIVASSGFALSAMIRRWGGDPVDLGIFPDTVDAIAGIADCASGADFVVTLGGASVGEHDLIQTALGPRGFEPDFWKIAMRPGKPLIYGRLGQTPFMGLPGNPVSTLVCALLFLKPAISALLGTIAESGIVSARLTRELKANDHRQDYVRAKVELRNGERLAEPFAVQDSSMLSVLARADALIVRPPHAPKAAIGDMVSILPLE